MVNISSANASAIINMLLEHPAKHKEQQVVGSRSEIIGSVIIALFDNTGYLDEQPAKRLGFYSARTLITCLLEHACQSYEQIPDEKIRECIKKLETVTGIKICG